MEPDLLSLYERASRWSTDLVAGAEQQLDADTPNDGWDVRTLLNHMLDTQHYFLGVARGEDVSPPSPNPPDIMGDDPSAEFQRGQAETLAAFAEPGVLEKTGPSLGFAFTDRLLHGWDLAQATGQDATMPDGLAEVAFEMIHGRLTDENRQGMFKHGIAIPDDASAQDKLLAYTGRYPSWRS